MISDYAGLNFKEIQELYIDEFALLYRDAFIYKMNSTDGGRKYLEQCYLADNERARRDKLKQVFGGG